MSTSKNWGAAALVSCALLLSGCSALEDMASDFMPSGEEVQQEAEPTPDAVEAPVSTGKYSLVETCNAFFSGALVQNIGNLAPAVAAPLDEERTGQASGVSKGIGLIIGEADEVSIAHLEAVRAPFDQALDGSIARPKAVQKAVGDYQTACKEAGWKG
ncbi:hypothetical protein ACFQBY_09420 [Promicromonospora citrea]|uniref:Lipoprotein n=1 Tax=Promicromonospora citrea TaxID=43677 RepID=A0A8H9GE67_9MICO|nr:hypothetical protein [Promicromonospora citrea]NNH55099.1 hypothetical protein [Promicromonospora citrea]GGM10523.1 hypothetical protein GCM10010102_02930 [Promicromonospora citrea]